MVCDVSAALRDSLSADRNLQTQLVSTTKRILLTKIEYEDLDTHTNCDALKSKYIVLKPTSGVVSGVTAQPKMPGVSAAGPCSSTNGTSSASANGRDAQLPAPKRVLFARDSVQVGWRASGRKWQVGAGLINMGNTCYLNSTLQALFHVPAIANWLMADESHRDKCEDLGGGQGGCIICAMARTLISSQSSQSPIKPWLIHSKLRLVCKHFFPGRQEDAHEFLRYLVEAMEKAYLGRVKNSRDLDQYSKETTPLNQILGGYLRSTVRCLACGHVSTTFQHFEDLLLDIRKANTVEEALGGYFARERLEDMGYKCEACKKKTSATKQFSLERAPVALCIQLKRFSMAGTKLNKHVAIRSRLDLTPYTRGGSATAPLVYRLVAMVTHLGASQNCGHYTAIGLTDTGSYYHFDDSSVRPISLQNVLQTNAYIIFYELEEGPTRVHQTPPSTATSASSREGALNGDLVNGSTNGVGTSQKASESPVKQFAAGAVSKLETMPGFIGPLLPGEREKSPEPRKVTLNGEPHQKITFNITPPSARVLSSQNSQSKLVSVTKKIHFNGSSNGVKAAEMTPPAAKKVKLTAVTPLQAKPKSLVPYESDDESNPSENEDPVIVKTAAGVYKVTPVDEAVVKGVTNGPVRKAENGTEIRNTATVKTLVNMGGPWGYGTSSVYTWNGQKTTIDREVQEEKKEERKRELEHQAENGDFDRGKMKKVKMHHPPGKDNPGFNPFQEYQMRNWSWINNGRQGYQGHIYRQKSHHYQPYRGHGGGGFRGRHRGVFHSNFRSHHGYRRDK
ncbi:ubiquitin carboxyl-terminal hydrolase 36 [Phlebotomus argentipes]|uniref:ubiquitin carboxyl-terminal hydrolase 36 n=1 Tax=Phlebotomus argentipes TaxID=94469 RepID=UPI002892FE8D|nr:ubiquitin carboxyl-terminal hydrolase 36 [Phlebotomus argentipes]